MARLYVCEKRAVFPSPRASVLADLIISVKILWIVRKLTEKKIFKKILIWKYSAMLAAKTVDYACAVKCVYKDYIPRASCNQLAQPALFFVSLSSFSSLLYTRCSFRAIYTAYMIPTSLVSSYETMNSIIPSVFKVYSKYMYRINMHSTNHCKFYKIFNKQLIIEM